MLFDDTISDDVNLSEILDAFIVENEGISVIYRFLNDHDDSFTEIISMSLYGSSLYDYFNLVSYPHLIQEYFINHLEDTPIDVITYTYWKIMASRDTSLRSLINNFKNSIKDPKIRTALLGGIRHPYSSHLAKLSREFDKLIISKSISLSHVIQKVADKFTDQFVSIISHSIFANEIYRSSLFLDVDDKTKFILLKSFNDFALVYSRIMPYTYCHDASTFNHRNQVALKDFVHLIFRTDIGAEYKKEFLKILKYNDYIIYHDSTTSTSIFRISNDIRNLLDGDITPAELIIEALLSGEQLFMPNIYLYVLLNKFSMVKELIELDSETFEKCIPGYAEFIDISQD